MDIIICLSRVEMVERRIKQATLIGGLGDYLLVKLMYIKENGACKG